MPYTVSTGTRLYYEVFGAAGDPLLVLVSGTGAQLIGWDERLIGMLTAGGLRVVRFDNRDTGLSERFGGEDDVDGGYGLEDLADDIVRILDDLGVDSAHIAGHSMGGMIAQLLAIRTPGRVRSLTLISSTPGTSRRYVLHDDPAELLEPPVRLTREQAVSLTEAMIAAAPRTRFDPQLAWHREKAGEAYDRGYAPEGYHRQWAAMRRAPERLKDLRSVTVPALVFHGRSDDVLHWNAAVDIAEAIEGAELQIHPEMGHLIPHELWSELASAMLRTAMRAEDAR